MGAVLVVKADKKGKKNDEKDIIDRMRRRHERLKRRSPESTMSEARARAEGYRPDNDIHDVRAQNEDFEEWKRENVPEGFADTDVAGMTPDEFESWLLRIIAQSGPIMQPEDEEEIEMGGDWSYSGYDETGEGGRKTGFSKPPELWPNDFLYHILTDLEHDWENKRAPHGLQRLERKNIEDILSDSKREMARRLAAGNWPHVATKNERVNPTTGEVEEGWNPTRNVNAKIVPEYYDEMGMSSVPEYVGLEANPMGGRDTHLEGKPYRTTPGPFGVQVMTENKKRSLGLPPEAVGFSDFQDLNRGEPMNPLDESWSILKR